MNVSLNKVTPENAIKTINELPDETPNGPADYIKAVKALALDRIQDVKFIGRNNALDVNLRVHVIAGFEQHELQISQNYIPPVRIPVVAILIAFLMLCGLSGKAQTFGGGVTLNGQTNAIINPAMTNTVFFVPPPKTVTIGNIAFSNEFFNVWYCGSIPGFTNLFPLYLFQTNSVAGTNNGTMTFTISPPQLSFNVVTAMLVSNGPSITGPTNTLFVP